MDTATPPPPGPATAPIPPLPVYSLQCHRDVEMALRFLPTLLRRCRDPIELVINDDGTLTAEDRDRFAAALGPVRIITREEADDLILPQLAARPRCLAYRRSHAFGIKLFDAALLSAGPFAHCDGDLAFLRPFAGLDRRGAGGEDLVFMRDYLSSYAFTFRRRYFGPHRSPMADYVNAGFLYCHPRAYDLDFIEWYLGKPGFSTDHRLAEQTVWAALAGRCRSRAFDHRQVDFPFPSLDFRDAWVVLHFITPLRYIVHEPGYVDALLAWADGRDAAPPATLGALPSVRLNLAHYILSRGYRKLRPDYIQQICYGGAVPIAESARLPRKA